MKFILLLVVLSVLCRWALGRWPWDYLRSPRPGSPSLGEARSLLGVGPQAGREEVIAAHRRLVADIHPDRGGTTAAMQEANAARDLLLAHLPPPGTRPADPEQADGP